MAIVDDSPQVKVKCIEFIDNGNANTPFIRNYVYDECGDLTNTFDILQDGTAYTVTGPIQKENSGTTTLDVTGIETTTTVVDNLDGTFTYTNEDGVPVTVSTGSGDHGDLAGLADDDHPQYLNEVRHDNLPSDNPHSVTATQVGLGNVPNIDASDRANHTGTQTASTISDFLTAVQANETTTSISLSSNVLTYVDENGASTNIDLSIVSGIVTFSRDDSSTFTVDFSGLLGDNFSIYETFQTGTTSRILPNRVFHKLWRNPGNGCR